jgi:hypothetical protein
MTGSSLRLSCLRPAGIPLAVALALQAAALAGDTRQDCRRWAASGGLARVALGNQLGAEHLLTKNRNFSEATPDDRRSLYFDGDIRRLCANY